MRELIHTYLLVKGMFFEFPALLIAHFPFTSWFSDSELNQLMDRWTGPTVKAGEGAWWWEQSGNWASPTSAASSWVGSFTLGNRYI